MHCDEPAWYRIPHERELADQYLLLYEMSLPYGLDLNDHINVINSARRMTVTLKGTTARQQRAIDQRAYQWLVDNTPTSLYSVGTCLSLMWARISGRDIHEPGTEDAVRHAFSTVGTAGWVTTSAPNASFLVLLLPGHKMSADMGLIFAAKIMISLILDVLLLPTLLIKRKIQFRICSICALVLHTHRIPASGRRSHTANARF